MAVSKPDCTLDTLIEEHAKYLNNITHKGLLGSGSKRKEGSLISQLHEMLKVIMSFKEGMVSYFVNESNRRMHCTAIRWRNMLVGRLSRVVLRNAQPLYVSVVQD